MHGTGELVVIAVSAVPLPLQPRKCWYSQLHLHWCIKIVSDWLCSVTTSMVVVGENEYFWTWGRSQSTKVPVTLLVWGAQEWEAMGEVCLESPPPILRTHGTDLECQIGHSAPGLECSHLLLTFSYFLKHMQSIYQAIKNTLWGGAICNCSCQNERSCLCEAGDSVFREEWVALGFDVMFTYCLTKPSAMLELPVLKSKNSALSGELQTGGCESELPTHDVHVAQTPSPYVTVSRGTQASPCHLLSKRREKMPVGKATSVVLLWHLGSRCAPSDCLPACSCGCELSQILKQQGQRGFTKQSLRLCSPGSTYPW